MELRHLRYFLCVAEEMHFGRAAARLGISQPPLSQQIRALEHELGVRLFDRTSRRVRLTEAGRLFEPEARRTLMQAEQAAEIAQRAQRGEVGHLAIGFIASAPFVPSVASALFRFRQTHPKVDLTLQELGRDEQFAWLEGRRLDLGLIRGFERPALADGMTPTCLLEENMVLALRSDHPLAQRKQAPDIADLAGEPLVLYGPTNGAGFNEHFLAMCRQADFTPDIVYEASSLAALLGLAAAGFGATVLAPSLARLHVDNLVSRPFAEPIVTRLWLIEGRELSPTGKAFKTILLEETNKARRLSSSG